MAQSMGWASGSEWHYDMKKKRGMIEFLIRLLMPFILILSGAGLATLGVTQTSLMLIVAGLIVAAAGVLWSVIMLDLTNPFDLF